ncbi:MAG: hypothetical protein U0931_27010 [Vulcanimicrobiota bacterium]
MLIPGAQLQLNNVAYGTTQRVQHPQFGTVELESDGVVDDCFKDMNNQDQTASWTSFRDPALTSLVTSCQLHAQQTLTDARARFEAARPTTQSMLDQAASGARSALEQSGLPGWVVTYPDSRGVLTSTIVDFGQKQRLYITHGGEQPEARLVSRLNGGTHDITVPLGKQGEVLLENSTESLVLNTPWLTSDSLRSVREQDFKELSDPRLEKLAEAATKGSPLAPNALGDGWVLQSQPDTSRQAWSSGRQQVELDLHNHMVILSSESDFSVRGGETDVEARSSVQWQDGRMSLRSSGHKIY